jgi:hypothetical protein
MVQLLLAKVHWYNCCHLTAGATVCAWLGAIDAMNSDSVATVKKILFCMEDNFIIRLNK